MASRWWASRSPLPRFALRALPPGHSGRTLVDARTLGEEPVVGTGLANVLWVIFAGIWLWISHVVAGIAYCLTIIGIPFGFAHFRLAAISFAPLGKRVVFVD